MEEATKGTGSRWVVMATLTIAIATLISINQLLGLLLPDIAKDLGLSPSQQGWLGSSSLLTILFLSIPTNTLVSRYRPWRVASLAFLGGAGFIILQARAPAFAILLIGRMGMGLGFTMSQAPRSLLVQQWSSRSQLAPTNGAMFASNHLMLALVFFITPLILTWADGWRNALSIWGGVCLLAALAWVVLGKERITLDYQESMSSQSGTPLASLLKYRELWILGMGTFGVMVVTSAFAVFWPTLAQDQLQLSITVVGLAIGIGHFAAAPIGLLINMMPLFTQRKLPVLAVCALVTFGAHLGLVFTSSIALVLVLAIAKGASSTMFPVVRNMVYRLPEITPREVAVGTSFIQTCSFMGAAIGPLLVGFLQEVTDDLQLALLVTVFFPLSLLATVILLWTKVPREFREAAT